MRNFTIQSGTFTGAGNFTAYSAKGERVFIHKRIMESQGFSNTNKPTFPLFAIIDNKMIGQFADDGVTAKLNPDGTPLLVERLQALSIFKTKQAMVDAYVDDATLDIEIHQAVTSKATATGLSADSLAQLMSVVF